MKLQMSSKTKFDMKWNGKAKNNKQNQWKNKQNQGNSEHSQWKSKQNERTRKHNQRKKQAKPKKKTSNTKDKNKRNRGQKQQRQGKVMLKRVGEAMDEFLDVPCEGLWMTQSKWRLGSGIGS